MKRENKITSILILILISTFLFLGFSYAALVTFYRSDDRIQIQSDFYYEVSSMSGGVSVDDENMMFSLPSGNTTYTITFNINRSSEGDIYYAVYYDEASSGIINISGGARGYISTGSGSVSKQVNVQVNSGSSQNVIIGIINITEDEYNDLSLIIEDEINDITYILISN